MADTAKTPKRIKIEAQEYTEMQKACDDLKRRMDEADSDVAYQGYRRAWTELTRAYDKATAEIHAVERAETRKTSKEKRTARVQHTRTKAS